MIAAIKNVLLLPRAEKFHQTKKISLTLQIKCLSGKAICLVDNCRSNAQPLMDSIAEVLASDYPDAKLARFRKDMEASATKATTILAKSKLLSHQFRHHDPGPGGS